MIISHPFPHILKPTTKQLHGWWPGKRECTGERLLINPYNGCSVGCFFCYTRGFPGNFRLWHDRGLITVSKDFPLKIARQLDSIRVASCGYLSPVTDPFQELEKHYRYSEKIVEIFVRRNIPIEVVTKCWIPDRVIHLLSLQPDSFAQVSILTLEEGKRKLLSPGGADTTSLLKNMERLKEADIYTVARIDPVIPFVTDHREELLSLIRELKKRGASHVVTSVLDIPLNIQDFFWKNIRRFWGKGVEKKMKELYQEKLGPYLHADIGYRREIFSWLKETVTREGMSFALCMEFEVKGEKVEGLNHTYMTTLNCEGKDIPIYIRKNNHFEPASSCPGNCLNCKIPLCGIEDLAMGREGSKKDWKLKDYRRWSKILYPYLPF